MKMLSGIARSGLVLFTLASVLTACSSDGSATDTVSSESGRVRVTTDPFSLRVEDNTGKLVLTTLARTEDAGDTLYAPLGFVTGDDPELRYQVLTGLGEQPDPNPTNPVPPKRYSATEVRSMERSGDTLLVVLDTDDPDGRTMTLRIAPDETGALVVDAEVSDAAGVSAVFASFASPPDEAFHGFGGRRESTDLRGLAFQNWVQDYRFPDLTTGYYYAQPQFISSQGYGLFVDTDALASWRLASDLDDAWRLIAAGDRLPLLIAPGDGARATALLTEATGRHRVAPAWSLGPTLSRTVITRPGVETAETYRDRVLDDLAMIESRDLGVEAYAFEGWARLEPDFVSEVIQRLAGEGIRAILYIRPFVAEDLVLTEPSGRFAEAVDQGYVATTAAGAPYIYPNSFDAGEAAVIDFTKPEARSWWKGLVQQMLDLGADGFMNDFGEQVIADMHFSDGSTGATLHNAYPRLQHEATREGIDEYLVEHPDREIFFFVRAGYSGRAGSAAFESATFPGDEAVDWSAENGLPSIVPDMLNRAVGGAYGFSTDIGGYADWTGIPGTSKELFVRWAQAAVFTTHFRVHGSAFNGVRMPWFFEPGDPEPKAEALWKAAADLHVRARPLILQLWQEAVDTGMPITRPMWLHDPSAEGNPHNDDQWMLGPDLLIAPVLEKGATQREVWLPEGCWQLHGEGEELGGRANVTVDAPLDVLPWFTRCGASPL